MRKIALVSALLALLATAFAAAPGASAAPMACPTFRVLHDDRIGPAVLPAGTYSVAVAPASGLSCAAASTLFTRFLEDWDGVLPRPWLVVAQGRGKAAFKRGAALGFSVSRVGGGGEGGEEGSTLGALCKGRFTVNVSTWVGPVFFTRGAYLIYIPPRSAMPCRRASVMLTRFLGTADGELPSPWRANANTGTFFRTQNPARSAFRVEPASGAGIR